MRNLKNAMKIFNVTFHDLQRVMGCCEKTVRNKLNGKTDFSYPETRRIRNNLFPGMEIEYLFDAGDSSGKGD